jgi:chemotaxis protein methyltransferase CheR
LAKSDQSADTTCALKLSPEVYDRLAKFITSELGIKMPATKVSLIQSRLVRRVRELGLSSIDEYEEYLFGPGGSEERECFFNAITTNKTDFFREPEHFRYLTEVALPSMQQSSEYDPDRTRLWSAACSSGEEPYTLAMVLSEYARLHAGFDFSILGTDISTKVLQKARQGIYTKEQVAPVTRAMRQRYLLQSRQPDDGLVRIIPALRQKLSCHKMNFMAHGYRIQDRFDIIFLRNVLIYFDKPTQEMVVNRVCRHLKRGGYLFVSHAESLSDLEIPVRRVHTSVYRQPL